MASLESYSVRLSLAEGSNPPPGPLAPLLELLRHPPTSENPIPCVVLTIHDSQLFNAVDEMANLFMEQGILAGIMTLQYGKKELFTPVPNDSTLGIISGKMEQLAASVGVDVHMRMEPFVNLAASVSTVFDILIRTVLKFQLLSNGCLQFEKRNQAPQILMISEPRSGEAPTIAVLSVKLVTDTEGRPVIELECMPKVMMLRTLAEPTDPSQPGYDPLYFAPTSGSVMVMPRLGEGWLVSHYGQTLVCQPSAGHKREKHEVIEYKTQRVEDAKPEGIAQPLLSFGKKGFHRYAPESDEEFRRYWFGVHRIRLPQNFGGYGRVRFSGELELTYPACCIAYQWTILPSETWAKSSEVIKQFQLLLQQMIGKRAVTVSSAHEPPSSTKLLPAVDLLHRGDQARSQNELRGRKYEQSRYKRQLIGGVEEEKAINPKKQRTRGHRQQTKKQRRKSQRVKSQRVEGQRMK